MNHLVIIVVVVALGAIFVIHLVLGLSSSLFKGALSLSFFVPPSLLLFSILLISSFFSLPLYLARPTYPFSYFISTYLLPFSSLYLLKVIVVVVAALAILNRVNTNYIYNAALTNMLTALREIDCAICTFNPT